MATVCPSFPNFSFQKPLGSGDDFSDLIISKLLKAICSISNDCKSVCHGFNDVPNNEKSKDIIEFQSSKHKYYKNWHDFRLVDFQKYNIESQIIITENDITIISVTESETWAVRFLDKPIIQTFNALFDALWINAKVYS